MKRLGKWLLGIVMAGIAGILVMELLARLVFGKQYTKQDLVDNYQARTSEIKEVRRYGATIAPALPRVYVEFEDDELRTLQVDGIGRYDAHSPADSATRTLLLHHLGWPPQTLATLQQRLAAANCIAIESGEPFTVGYQRSGMSMYLYKLPGRPLSDSLRRLYNSDCEYILYKPDVVLEYRGGALGADCFYGDRRHN